MWLSLLYEDHRVILLMLSSSLGQQPVKPNAEILALKMFIVLVFLCVQ